MEQKDQEHNELERERIRVHYVPDDQLTEEELAVKYRRSITKVIGTGVHATHC